MGRGERPQRDDGEMAREYAGRVRFAIVDVDSYCPGIALAYANKGVAALFALLDGEVKGHMAALEAKADIWSWIEAALGVPPSRGVSVSVWPEYAEAIAASTKQVEFRRTRITAPVTHMAFYATALEKRLACVCDAFVEWDDVEALWVWWWDKCGVSREEFDSYFGGCEEGLTIELG